MNRENSTTFNFFTLSGLSDVLEIQILLFITFVFIYIISVSGNVLIIFAYTFSPSMHTPMYFCLANFSFLEICYISTTVPNFLSNLLTTQKTISFFGCAIQLFCFPLFGVTECFILATMAYDRYNAICHPLLYNALMNKRTCSILIAVSWLIAAINSLIHTVLTLNLPFCGHNVLDGFFCDIPPLLKLACTNNILINHVLIFVSGSFILAGPFILTVISYMRIIATIVRLSSRKRKAFSTCTSHITAVALFYVPSVSMYFGHKSSQMTIQDKTTTVIYAVIVPLLNPFIYSIRNNDVKVAVKKILNKIIVYRRC
ncbi:hypothetical protein GDO86_012604 [Hymenochirus boettgeri]|uniref:Olfactory receptor n=1 Tax=Hymenochirus boettgeri TaxID=247094 RepID=A0A8T2ITF6_9PIPI|nr:hypothetical protein GDO86_012604 [Hymenochirus boettgeri]